MIDVFKKDCAKLACALIALMASFALFGADQKPLVVNPTSGKTEQMQTGNNLLIPGNVILSGDRTILTNSNANAVNILGGTAGNVDPFIQLFGSTYPGVGGRAYLDSSRFVVRNINGAASTIVDVSGDVLTNGTTSVFSANGQGNGIRLGGFANIFQADGTPSATDVRLGLRPGTSTTVSGLQFSMFSTDYALIDAGTFTTPGAFSVVKNLALNAQGAGEVLIGTITDSGAYRLQVNGNILSTANNLDFNSAGAKQINNYGGGALQLVGRSAGDTVEIYTGGTILAINVSAAQVTTFSGPTVTPTKTPASAGAAGIAGEWAWDADYIYICIATNTWKRVAVSTWP